MTLAFVAPVILAALTVAGTALVDSTALPRLYARVVASTALVVALIWFGVSAFISIKYLVQHLDAGENVVALLPNVAARHIDHWLGNSAILAFVTSLVAVLYWLSSRTSHSWPVGDVDNDLVVLDVDELVACVKPGRSGYVIVSTGVLNKLNGAERRVVLAHERAHLYLHHDRYVEMTRLAARFLPLFWPLTNALRLSVESWADAEAVRTTGDRRLVATTIAKVALLGKASGAAPSLALASHHTSTRVRRLLGPRRSVTRAAYMSALAGLGIIAVAASSVQVHSLATFVWFIAAHPA